MELHQLRYFQMVARLGHMTQAAEMLHVAQPSLSRSIAQLERELGVPLFGRTGRRIYLNQYGEILLRRVEFILNDLERARREITDLQGEAQGLVSLSVSYSSGGYLLSRLLSGFRAHYPGIRFQVNAYHDTPHGRFAVFRQLEEGQANLCLCPPVREGAAATEWRPVVTDELVLAVPPGHRLARNERLPLSEAANEPFVGLRAETSLRVLTDAMCQRARFVADMVIEVEDLSSIADLVAAGAGVAIVPAHVQQSSGQVPALLRLEGESAQWTVGVAWDEHYYLPLAARLFRQFLVDHTGAPSPPETIV